MGNYGLKLTFDLLPVVAGLISVLAWVVPKFKDWFANLTADRKQLFMVGVLFASAAGASILSFLNLVPIYPVDQGLQGLVWQPLVDFVFALLTNAGVYKATNKIFERRV